MWNGKFITTTFIQYTTNYQLLFLMIFVLSEMMMILKLNSHRNWVNNVLMIVMCYFVTEMLSLWNRNCILDNGWFNGYDVNYNEINDV